jgi:Flp pilus assembly protein TadG
MNSESKRQMTRNGPLRSLRRSAPWRRASVISFAKREDGTLLVLGMTLFMIMAMMGGLAIDLMRYEQSRTLLQQTLDRSVLAGAAMSQELTGEAVVTDYFAKAGMSDALDSVDVEQGDNFRIVTATASSKLTTYFMHMIGINEIETDTAAVAEQRVTDIEVSMVLDISGSMSGTRINALRPAAKEFVTTVLAAAEEGHVSISIVPYNAQVNIGQSMMNAFNVDDTHSSSACIELPDSTFSSIDVSTTTKYVHNAHFDPYNYTSGSSNMLYNCPPQIGNNVTPLSNSETALHAAISDLTVGGNTSIDVGVKWGAYLLNNNANPVVAQLVTAGKVSSNFADRPLSSVTSDTLKVLVVMTDGENTTEYKINNPYNTGSSNIYQNNSDSRISVYYNRSNTTNDWWWPRTNSWSSKRDTSSSASNAQDASKYTQLTWPEVWKNYSVTYVAYHFYALPLGDSYTTWRNTFMTSVYSNKNTRLQSVCTAAKSQNIVVYGIGFEAPTDGRTQVQACASSTAHYFDASSVSISSAFRAIANNISQLRLTQ